MPMIHINVARAHSHEENKYAFFLISSLQYDQGSRLKAPLHWLYCAVLHHTTLHFIALNTHSLAYYVMISEPWTDAVCLRAGVPQAWAVLPAGLMCVEYEVALLHVVLEKGARELMRALHEDYTKFHKFRGKVWDSSSQLTSGCNSVMPSE